MTSYLKNKAAYAFFLLPSLLLFLFTVLLPILWSSVYSLFSWDGISDFKFVGLQNYSNLLFNDDTFWQCFRNNIFYVVINTVFQIITGLLIAILLTKLRRGTSIFQTLFFTPTVISSVAISQLFQNVLSVEPVGLLNYLLQSIGLGDHAQAWLSNPDTALISVSLIESYRFIGIYMIIFYTALISIPQEYLEAAKLDGAVDIKLFWYIKYPLIKGVIAVAIVMVVNGTLKGFDIPYILTNGGPGRFTELIATYMYKTAFLTAKFGYGSAMAVFLALESLIMITFLRKVYA
jgi:raffinose/stachyose/melibiose transport system permease protein